MKKREGRTSVPSALPALTDATAAFVRILRGLHHRGRDRELCLQAEAWLAQNEADPDVLTQLARARFTLGDPEAALIAGQRALSIRPSSATLAANTLLAMRRTKRLAEAVSLGNGWIAEHGVEDGVLRQLSRACLERKDWDDAAFHFRTGLAQLGSDADLACGYLEALLRGGKTVEAWTFGEEWITKQRPDADFLELVGQAARQLGEFDTARTHFSEAALLRPADPSLMASIMDVLISLEQPDEAVRLGEAWAGEYEPSADFMNMLGVAAGRTGNNSAAAEFYRRGLEIEPSNVQLATNLIVACRALRRLREADAFATAWRREHGQNAQFLCEASCVAWDLSDFERAVDLAELAQRLEPSSATMAANVVEGHRALGRPEEAVAFARVWVASHPTSPYFLARMAEAFIALERWDEAIAHLQTALVDEPSEETLHARLEFSRQSATNAREPKHVTSPVAAVPQPAARAQEEASGWADSILEPKTRQVLLHLEKHGVITEQEATGLLGTPRAFRRFSVKLEQYLVKIPFSVKVESSESGKRFIRT